MRLINRTFRNLLTVDRSNLYHLSTIVSLTKDEQAILNAIHIPSIDNPDLPEFPPENPRFPATPVYRIKVPGFKDVWLKDESYNPTGTHKDRMAWEMVVTYYDLLVSKAQGRIKKIPQMSLISSGSAANAIQTMLKHYRLPNLKVLIDFRLDEKMKKHLKKIGCELFETDLAKKPLYTKEILALTHNINGIDVTSDKTLDPNLRFYDWLSYEIINEAPDYCFIPYGSGHLFENILNINKKEIASHTRGTDRRFSGDAKKLSGCHFLGATTNNPCSLADKLFSNHLPFQDLDSHWLRIFRNRGYCGKKTGIYIVQELYLKKAIQLAHQQNIACEPSGIAGLALLLQMRKEIPTAKKILIVSTGVSRIN